jgi:hypothetical protein
MDEEECYIVCDASIFTAEDEEFARKLQQEEDKKISNAIITRPKYVIITLTSHH